MTKLCARQSGNHNSIPNNFSFLQSVHGNSGAHQLTSQHAQMASSKGGKWLVNEADPSPLHMAKNLIIYVAMPSPPSCLHNVHWVNFTFTLSASLKYMYNKVS